jgi:two-component system, OmpR family, sensor histidine kinase QseC
VLTQIRQFFTQPTLARRGFLTTSGAFVLVLAVLLAYDFNRAKRNEANDLTLRAFGGALLQSLSDIHSDREARVFMQGTETWVNRRRMENPVLLNRLQLELKDAAQTLVYASQPTAQDHPHGSYVAFEGRDARWHLRVVAAKRSNIQILRVNAGLLLPYLLIALPFVLVPLWFSVRMGLKPLQTLAEHIASRHENDVRALGIQVKHAELKPLVSSLDGLLAQLRVRIARERSFVHDAAHELRTPMAVISAQAHALANAANQYDRQQSHEHLNQAIARASHLTDQLLSLAALEDGQKPRLKPVDLAQHVRQTLASAMPRALAKQIEIELDSPDTLPGEWDVAAFDSILSNLLDNCLNYCQASASILIRLYQDASMLVQDDGPGIPLPEQERVFERFYRGTGHQQSGSGLGLAIVKQAAQRLNATVVIGPGIGAKGEGVSFHLAMAR